MACMRKACYLERPGKANGLSRKSIKAMKFITLVIGNQFKCQVQSNKKGATAISVTP
jgi:hypothetical protein